MIPILSILVHILYAPKSPPSYSIGDIAMWHTLSVARFIAMQVGTLVRSHCNEGTGTGLTCLFIAAQFPQEHHARR